MWIVNGLVNLHGPVWEETEQEFSFVETKTHPKTAVDSGDEHDGHEDDEAADEEAHHHIGTAGRTHKVIKCTRGTPPLAGAHSLPTSQLLHPNVI